MELQTEQNKLHLDWIIANKVEMLSIAWARIKDTDTEFIMSRAYSMSV